MLRHAWLALCFLLLPGAARAEVVWHYDAHYKGGTLAVEAQFQPNSSRELSVNDGCEPFVRDVEVQRGGRWVAVPEHGGSWRIARGETRVRYRFMLAEGGKKVNDDDTLDTRGDIVVAAPGAFLLRPFHDDKGTLDVKVDGEFVSGMPSAGKSVWQLPVEQIPFGPNGVFGPIKVVPVKVPGATLDVAFVPGSLPLADAEVPQWVHRKAEAVARFYHRFPVPHALILILGKAGDDINGDTVGSGGTSITLVLGKNQSTEAVEKSWTITHEMVHTALPSVERRHHWLEEGLATYLEPIVRVRVGELTPQKVWHDMVKGLPQGEPEKGDRGLDNTHTWGRTYWGGCLFCLLADVKIHEQTHNQKGLPDAMRGILEAGGDIRDDWPIEKVLQVGDRAVGLHVLEDLYAEMKDQPHPVDLDVLWKQLGVKADGTFYDAPEAAVRDAISAVEHR